MEKRQIRMNGKRLIKTNDKLTNDNEPKRKDEGKIPTKNH